MAGLRELASLRDDRILPLGIYNGTATARRFAVNVDSRILLHGPVRAILSGGHLRVMASGKKLLNSQG